MASEVVRDVTKGNVRRKTWAERRLEDVHCTQEI